MSAIVTGGSGGIGRAVCVELAGRGMRVAVCYNSSRSDAEETLRLVRQAGGDGVCLGADLSSSGQIKRLFDDAEICLGEVDVLVNCAGTAMQKMLTDTTDSDFDRLIYSNLGSVFFCCREAASRMIKRKSGVIINTSSVWGLHGASCESVYSAAKSGIIGFTQAIADELAPSGIRVCCVAPGVIDTKMNAHLTKDDMEELRLSTPLEKIGTPEQVAKAVAFLASSDADFITGVTLPVTGGFR